MSSRTPFPVPANLEQQRKLAKILQRLCRDGLIVAHKGVHGGYRLARSPSAISIADVAQAVDGPLPLTTYSPVETRWDQVAACAVPDPLLIVTERVLALLRVLTVADLDALTPLTLQKQRADGALVGRTR